MSVKPDANWAMGLHEDVAQDRDPDLAMSSPGASSSAEGALPPEEPGDAPTSAAVVPGVVEEKISKKTQRPKKIIG